MGARLSASMFRCRINRAVGLWHKQIFAFIEARFNWIEMPVRHVASY